MYEPLEAFENVGRIVLALSPAGGLARRCTVGAATCPLGTVCALEKKRILFLGGALKLQVIRNKTFLKHLGVLSLAAPYPSIRRLSCVYFVSYLSRTPKPTPRKAMKAINWRPPRH